MASIKGPGIVPRRGVLLLVVLSMLTLFMMLGVSYIVVATRARKAARAFANNAVAATTAAITDQTLLDQAFLTLVRGSPLPLSDPDQPACLGTTATGGECLLGDKYGFAVSGSSTRSITGTLTSASAALSSGNSGPAFFQVVVGGLSPAPAQPSDLVGRVLTFSMPGLSASTRILQASGAASAPTLVIAAGPTVSGKQLSAAIAAAARTSVTGTAAATIIINGREFAGAATDTNESWDGIDARNPLLASLKTEDTNGNGRLESAEDTNSNNVLDAHLEMATATGFIGAASSLPAVDNDNDGQSDSKFVDIGLPPVVGPNGAVMLPRAAFLVTDLDGRLNLNVHGSSTDESTFTLTAGGDMYPPVVTATGTAVPLYQLPRGSGVGPADVSIDRSLLFDANPATIPDRVISATLAFAGIQTINSKAQDGATQRLIPLVSYVEGRYGDAGASSSAFGGTISPTTSAKPGVAGVNDQISTDQDAWRCSLTSSKAADSYFSAPGRYGSPPDLKGLLKLWVDDAGQPVYYRPAWTGDPGSTAMAGTLANEVVDDPYEVNLAHTAVRGSNRNPLAGTPQQADALFTPGELEAILRFNDPDTVKLARRLVALSGANASLNRLAVTTESWDTPAIVGDAWQQVINGPFATFLNATGLSAPKRPQDLFAPEILQGHRMDLNRPFHDTPNFDEPNDATGTARRQAFAKQLYCLLVAVARVNGATITPAVAEQIAQYAVNVVDFRDKDSVMTRFDYDPAFSSANTGWNPGTNDTVWGCERPEVLITETWAWHNRRTEDTNTGGSSYDLPTATADEDFDQKRRPQGAFFVELFSPWSSTAARYDAATGRPAAVKDVANNAETLRAEPLPAELAGDEDADGDGSLDDGEDLNGNGVLDMRSWAGSAINLSGTAPAASPIWRLVTVRGTNAFGTDPVIASSTNSTLSILDPARPGSTTAIDRAFYFAQPSNAIQLSTGSNSAFWQQTAGGKCPNASTYVVVGTDAPFSPLTSGTAATDVRVLKGPNGQPATITEPLTSAADPYDAMMQAASPGNTYSAPAVGNSFVGQWTNAIDSPLDADTSPPAAITSAAFLTGGNPLLMINGTHDNFAVVHLQRLANPAIAWNANSNPYLTVDSMTVDLTVVNTSTNGSNYDEPGTTGPAPRAYLATQKHYGRGSTLTAAESTERGGKLSQFTGSPKPAHDIWSGVVQAAKNTPIDAGDAASFRTAAVTARAATQPTAGGANATPVAAPSPSLVNTLAVIPAAPPTPSVPQTPQRFYDTSNNRPYSFAWLYWGNRPFNSPIELAYVPTTSSFSLLRWHTLGQGQPRPFAQLPGFFETANRPSPWDAIAGRTGSGAADRSLWHFMHVPSPFAGIYASAPQSANAAVLADLGLDVYPLGQLSRFREPGRINVNTIRDGRVWRGLFGTVTDRNDLPSPLATEPACESIPGWKPSLFTTGSSSGPCTSVMNFMQVLPRPGENTSPQNARPGGFLDRHVYEDRDEDGVLDPSEDTNGNGVFDTGEDVNGNGVLDPAEDNNGNGVIDRNDFRNTERHAFFRYQTMNRLTNNVTTRSNVFAVWVTIGYFDANNPTVEVVPVRRHRAFYIFDRSIPVGYEQGKDHNVMDAVLLRRIIQ